MRKNIKIICTIGSTISRPEVLRRLKDRGVAYFRINLSHTSKEEIEPRIIELQKYGVPLILDTESLQVRSGNEEEIFLKEGQQVEIYTHEIECSDKQLFLRPLDTPQKLSIGDLIHIDFNSALLKVLDISTIDQGYVSCIVLIEGKIGGSKGVYIEGEYDFPVLSDKDKKAIEIAKKYGITTFTLSFIKNKKDVEEFKSIYPNAKIYSKIECKKALENLREIVESSDGILIDRGDLSREIPIQIVPFIQKQVTKFTQTLGKEIIVATDTLGDMSFSLKPNRAEVNDIVNTLLDGATAIALTKETAVGKYPVETVNMLLNIINNVQYMEEENLKNSETLDIIKDLISDNPPNLLISPHGGVLVNRIADKNKSLNMPFKKIYIDEETLMDVEQIAVGAFSPLTGFMGSRDFYSVINIMRLDNDIVWPLPIILQVNENIKNNLSEGEKISLVYKDDGQTYAILHLKEIYRIDKKLSAKKIYGTDSLKHPGVKKFMEKGECLLGGDITLLKRRKSEYKFHELTPKQVRRIFSERGWSKVIGFHTRNVIHKSHEFIQLEGMKRGLCDGLFIHPIIGKKKPGDFESDVIINSYEKMIKEYYPKSKVVFSTFATYSRYCGPREAIFTALVRKNFGCSHFIVGRDHTGVKDFYHPKASHDIFDQFTKEELGIIPVKFDTVFYSEIEQRYLHEPDFPDHPEDKKLHISGTQARDMLKLGKQPPEWFMRPEISQLIIERINKGLPVFVKDY